MHLHSWCSRCITNTRDNDDDDVALAWIFTLKYVQNAVTLV